MDGACSGHEPTTTEWLGGVVWQVGDQGRGGASCGVAACALIHTIAPQACLHLFVFLSYFQPCPQLPPVLPTPPCPLPVPTCRVRGRSRQWRETEHSVVYVSPWHSTLSQTDPPPRNFLIYPLLVHASPPAVASTTQKRVMTTATLTTVAS